MSENSDNHAGKSTVSVFSVLKSALAALIGVQSNANRERDFQSGKFWHFFIAGGVVTVLFLLLVWLMVKAMMATA